MCADGAKDLIQVATTQQRRRAPTQVNRFERLLQVRSPVADLLREGIDQFLFKL